MTDKCKNTWCSGIIALLTLLGVFVSVYSIDSNQKSRRISTLESGRDQVVRVMTKLESVEENVFYIRTRLDTITGPNEHR